MNQVLVAVTLFVYPMATPRLQANPSSLSFVRETGRAGPFSGSFLTFVPISGGLDLKVVTEDGGNWLDVMNQVIPGNPTASVPVNVNSPNLAPGTYRATITGTSGTGTAQAKVVLTVLPKPRSTLVVSPASLSFTTSAGVESAFQTLTVSSPDGPVLFNLEELPPQLRLGAVDPFPAASMAGVSPSTLRFSALAASAGSYQGAIVLATSAGKVGVPVTVNVIASPASQPVLASVVNAASQLDGPIAPGEIVTVRGIGVGPPPVGVQLDAQGRVRTTAASDARVLINGIAAPIVYGSPNQWNVVVPYEVDGATTASLQVFSGGAASEKWTLPVAPSAPGIFSIGSTGIGRGAVLNQDNTVNDPSNPAPSGTIIQIFATGAGQLLPAGVTGSVTPAGGGGSTRLPVKVVFGGTEAMVVFAGTAPGAVSGVLQVNAVVPKVPFGFPAISVSIVVDGVASQQGVTVAVQ